MKSSKALFFSLFFIIIIIIVVVVVVVLEYVLVILETPFFILLKVRIAQMQDATWLPVLCLKILIFSESYYLIKTYFLQASFFRLRALFFSSFHSHLDYIVTFLVLIFFVFCVSLFSSIVLF